MLIVALLISVTMGPPVFFRQTRIGQHGRPFTLVKFRTMAPAREGQDEIASDRERLTRLGGFLRRFSLDELPELVGVLRGELSMVGPRPLLPEYLSLYSPRQARRHEVRPGLTGWAQVNGRNAISWPERLEMDVWYVDHQSLRLDLRILLMTVATVVRSSHHRSDGSVPMERFRGNQ